MMSNMNVIEIKAYKCPFCNHYSTDIDEVTKHASKCRNNPNYTQECLYCHNLERDFKQKILFPNANNPYCCCLHNNGSCPYKNHTDKELMQYIEETKAKLFEYGIIESKQGELVWKSESGDK